MIPMDKINHEIYKETIKQIRSNTKLIAVSGVCYLSMLRVYACVFCSISMLFVYMCRGVCVCLLVQGPLRECLRAGHFRASILLHTTCGRS